MVVKLIKNRRHYKIEEYYDINSSRIVKDLKDIETEDLLNTYQTNLSNSSDVKRLVNHKCKYDVEIIKYFF
jgi:hypothetical protein